MKVKNLILLSMLTMFLASCGEAGGDGKPSGKTDQELVDEVSQVWANATTATTYQQSKGTKTVSGFLIEESVTENNVNIIYKPADYPAPIGSITNTTIYVNAWFMPNSEEPKRIVTIDWEVDPTFFNYRSTSSDEVSQDAIRTKKEAFPAEGESVRTLITATFKLNEATRQNRYIIEFTTISYA